MSETPLSQAIERLEEILDQETAALRSHAKIDLKALNSRKSHGLLEFSRVIRQLEGAPQNEAIMSRLGSLRAKLETNRGVLKMHIEAVREVAAIVADAIREAESDGTYSLSLGNAAKRP